MTSSLIYALVAPALFWAFTWYSNKSFNPFAFAKEEHGGFSASKTQVLLFTYTGLLVITAFYIQSKFMDVSKFTIPSGDFNIPIKLASLMGISLVSLAGVKTVAQNREKEGASTRDSSSLTGDRSGNTDISKGQMLVWSAITSVTYVMEAIRILNGHGPVDSGKPLLSIPDVDTTMLVLMGVSQGGYLAGKLMNKDTATPVVETVLVQSEKIVILGTGFGGKVDEAEVLLTSPDQKTTMIPTANIKSWTPTRIEVDRRFAPVSAADFGPGKSFKIRVRANAIASSDADI
jgi:hypothetical protein